MDSEQEYIRYLWYSTVEAEERGDKEGAARSTFILCHLITTQDIEAQQREINQRATQAIDKIWEGRQQPNLPRCVLAAMNELKDIGVWDGDRNSSYILATRALENYNKMERERVGYLTAKKAYKDASMDYSHTLTNLATNLIYKKLHPLQTNSRDPLEWYFPGAKLIEICKSNGVEITFPTLRKYQRLGLIPPPIRLGRKAHYSALSILRVLAIDRAKKNGKSLSQIKEVIDDLLKIQLNLFYSIFPPSRDWWADACSTMTFLTEEGSEYLVEHIFGDKPELLGKNND